MNSVQRFRRIAGVCYAICAMVLGGNSPAFGDDSARVAITGLAHNLESFQHYRCKYRVTRANAATIDDVHAGKWVNAVSCDFRMTVDGERELFECLASAFTSEERKALIQKSGGVIVVPFAAGQLLRDGKRQLHHVPNIEVANLVLQEWGEHQFTGPTPLDMGFMAYHFVRAPHSMLSRPSENELTVEPRQAVGESLAEVVSFRKKAHLPFDLSRYYLDPDRGCLPIRYESYSTEQELLMKAPMVVAELVSARQCSRDRWFPERTIEYTPISKGTLRFAVQEILLTDLDADYRATDRDFTIKLPEGTYVKAGRDGTEFGNTFYRLKQNETVNYEQIDGMFHLLEASKKDRHIDTAVPRSSPMSRWRVAALGIGAILSVFFAIFAYRRRRSRRSPVSGV